jgi:hypothetical protein
MKKFYRGVVALVGVAAGVAGLLGGLTLGAGAQVVSPAEHLGRPVGTDFELADWGQVSGYYRKLDEQSGRVVVTSEGKTTEGREFLVAVISSEQNLASIEKLKAYARTISDPRGKTEAEKAQAVAECRVFVMVTPTMHSTEVAGTEMAMEFAYQLATSESEPWKSARDNAVIIMPLTLNPDGLDKVVSWYRKNVKTQYEGAGLAELYQKYAGHDNNRDWFMMSLDETRVQSRLMYEVWRPQVLWDVHQQGQTGERFFTPPYRDPLNPNIDPAIVAATNLVGTRAVLDLTAAGLSGVATGSTYDMWWHGGNRSTPARHNMISILTEAASANMASPVFLDLEKLKAPVGDKYGPSVDFVKPWMGGWWRVRDIIDYELAFGRSLLGTINREPEMWKRLVMQAAERQCSLEGRQVKGWVIPASNRDVTSVKRLADALLLAGIELQVATGEIEADGRKYPAGSIVIRRDQPWGAHVEDLFEVQRYPETKAPYDLAGWTLPLLMGVHRVEVVGKVPEAVKAVTTAEAAVGAFVGEGREGMVDSADMASWGRLAKLLAEGRPVTWMGGGEAAGYWKEGDTAGNAGVVLTKAKRIGIYAPYTASMDEGWLRLVFEQAGVPFVTVRNEQVRAGRLGEMVDVLIIADTTAAVLDGGRAEGTVPAELSGGLSPEGTVAVEEFVKQGGTLITFRNASRWAVKALGLGLVDVTEGEAAKGFSCPGSVLRGVPVEGEAVTAGLPGTLPVLFAGGLGWSNVALAESRALDVMMYYARTELLMSGYLAKGEVLAGSMAWVRVPVGKGRVHLFGFQPHFRSWTAASAGLIFRAAMVDGQPERSLAK